MTVEDVVTQLNALAGRVKGGINSMSLDGLLENGYRARADKPLAPASRTLTPR
jgi:hypothetical protein